MHFYRSEACGVVVRLIRIFELEVLPVDDPLSACLQQHPIPQLSVDYTQTQQPYNISTTLCKLYSTHSIQQSKALEIVRIIIRTLNIILINIAHFKAPHLIASNAVEVNWKNFCTVFK